MFFKLKTKKYIFLSLFFSIYSLLFYHYQATASFFDVNINHPYSEAVFFVQQKRLMTGSNGFFSPNDIVNRAEFVTVLVRARFNKEQIKTCSFPISDKFNDLPVESWFFPYVCTGVENGIINGFSDNTFRPFQPVTMAEAAKMILNTYGVRYFDSTIWYLPYLKHLIENKSVPLSVTSATSTLNRSETAELMYRYLNGGYNFVPHNYVFFTTRSVFTSSFSSADRQALLYKPELSVFSDKLKKQWKSELIRLVNQTRKKHGLKVLSSNQELEMAAQSYANDMASQHYYNKNHTDRLGREADERIKAAGYGQEDFSVCNCMVKKKYRENIARGQVSPQEVFNEWMDSQVHRDNILAGDIDDIGIGIASDYGNIIWVQNFGGIKIYPL